MLKINAKKAEYGKHICTEKNINYIFERTNGDILKVLKERDYIVLDSKNKSYLFWKYIMKTHDIKPYNNFHIFLVN